MSHTVTVTRTTTTTSTSAIILNTGYCKTTPGLLKIAEIIVGALILLCLFVFFDYDPYRHVTYYEPPVYCSAFKYTVVTFFIGSILLLLGCLVSISTGSIIAKTSYEFIYHGGAFILYTLATLWFLFQIRDQNFDYFKRYFYATGFGILNCVLYCISCVLAYRSYRWP